MIRAGMIAGLAGCAAAPSETEPVPPWEGAFLVDRVLIDCDGVQEWTYEVTTIGYGGEVTFDVVGRAYGAVIWREHGELPEVETFPESALYRLELAQVTTAAEQGESTAIPCDAKTLVTYGIATWRGADLEDCIAWGIDPEGEFPDCVNWGANGHGAL
jgi:hypothetical protein